MEQWKLMPESEGRYSVSDLGRIRREAYSYKFGDNFVKFDEKILSPKPSKDYVSFSFFVNNTRFRTAVHRMVARAFIPNPDNKPIVNHKNLDKLDNRAVNLEWATASENMKHSVSSQVYKKAGKFIPCDFYNMEGEEFRKFSDWVFVSNYGRVYKIRYKKGYFPKPQIHGGYESFTLNGKNIKIHRAIATLFLDNKGNLPIVNHINGNKFDNRENNLEWCSHSYNAKHAFLMGLNDMVGEKQSSSKHSKETVLSVIGMLNSGYSYNQIKDKTGVSTTQISNIKHGETWAHVTGVKPTKKKPLSVLTVDQVLRIKELAHSGVPMIKLAGMFGQTYQNIHKVATGIRWAYIAPELTLKRRSHV